MTSSVLVRRRLPQESPSAPTWSYTLGKYVGSFHRTIWAGDARYQTARPDRGRTFDLANTTTAIQMTRFVLPVEGGVWNGDLDADERVFHAEDEVIVLSNYFPHLDRNLPFVYKVRNFLPSGQAGLQTLITDVELKARMDA